MNKIIIVGVGLMATEIFRHNAEAVIVSSNPEFEPEPLVFKKNYFKGNETPFFEAEPSKFISKPKNNFKKR